MIDKYNHSVAKGDLYFTGFYLEKKYESKKAVSYMYPKQLHEAFVNIGEVFATNIAMNSDLTMDIEEYQSLCSMLF